MKQGRRLLLGLLLLLVLGCGLAWSTPARE